MKEHVEVHRIWYGMLYLAAAALNTHLETASVFGLPPRAVMIIDGIVIMFCAIAAIWFIGTGIWLWTKARLG